MPPKQEPDNSEHSTWNNWQDFCTPGHESQFEYSDKTEDHIMMGESQHFHYGRAEDGFKK